jgi:hypothetical protein
MCARNEWVGDMVLRVRTPMAVVALLATACTDTQPFAPVVQPEPLVWQTFPPVPSGARVFEHPDTVKGQVWRFVLEQDGVVRLQAVARVPLSRRHSIFEDRGSYWEQDSRIAFTWQLSDATGTVRGDTLELDPFDSLERQLNIPLRYLRPPSTRSPAADADERVFVEASPIYRNHGMPFDSRYVLYDDGKFALQFSGLFEYRGTYKESDGTITFEWEGWSVMGPWGATGTLNGDTLDVKYNLVMQLTDFIDGVYIRQR